jgi:protein O-GlcNAc transferase
MVLCHWNLGDAVRNIRTLAERAGVDPARFVFVPVVDHVKHLQRLQSMDLALDTLRHGGGVTTMDAFWVGLPVVAACPHPNHLHPCRGIFGSLSMSQEIAIDVASYISRAIELRNDQRSLAALRAKIAARRDGALMFDLARFTAEFQRLIQEMWARHLRGEEPATFTLAAR